MASTISKYDDLIDIRDVIARVEHLRQLHVPGPVDLGEDDSAIDQDDLFAELTELETLLDDLRGNGNGDEKWEGGWYPVILIRDSHFKAYAQELAEDIGGVDPGNARWPCTCIDWDQAARELRMDYSSTEFRGTTYWYR
jgi:hypothetical protein